MDPLSPLGCMGMSELCGGRDNQESLATVDLALELGIDTLDTSNVYGFQGENFRHNLELVGKVKKFTPTAGMTPELLAFAWVACARRRCYPRFRNQAPKEGNLSAADLFRAPDAVKALQELFPVDIAAGEHQVPAMKALVNV
jgi:aryl-alcohol dehydrogenase-like predicted oxidoreductase